MSEDYKRINRWRWIVFTIGMVFVELGGMTEGDHLIMAVAFIIFGVLTGSMALFLSERIGAKDYTLTDDIDE